VRLPVPSPSPKGCSEDGLLEHVAGRLEVVDESLEKGPARPRAPGCLDTEDTSILLLEMTRGMHVDLITRWRTLSHSVFPRSHLTCYVPAMISGLTNDINFFFSFIFVI